MKSHKNNTLSIEKKKNPFLFPLDKKKRKKRNQPNKALKEKHQSETDQVKMIRNLGADSRAGADFGLSSSGFRTAGERGRRETERRGLEGRRGISSVQADVRTIRGAPQCIVHSACQP